MFASDSLTNTTFIIVPQDVADALTSNVRALISKKIVKIMESQSINGSKVQRVAVVWMASLSGSVGPKVVIRLGVFVQGKQGTITTASKDLNDLVLAVKNVVIGYFKKVDRLSDMNEADILVTAEVGNVRIAI